MPTQIERMLFLLAALDRDLRVVRCRPMRRDHLYDGGQVFGSLMRHLCGVAPIEVALLPRGVIGPAPLRLLIAAAGATQRFLATSLATLVAAIQVAVVAEAAQEEQPPTAAAENKAQRCGGGVHGSRRGREELDAALEPCDEHLVVLTARACDTEGSSYQLGPSLFWLRPSVLSGYGAAGHFLARESSRSRFPRNFEITDRVGARSVREARGVVAGLVGAGACCAR